MQKGWKSSLKGQRTKKGWKTRQKGWFLMLIGWMMRVEGWLVSVLGCFWVERNNDIYKLRLAYYILRINATGYNLYWRNAYIWVLAAIL